MNASSIENRESKIENPSSFYRAVWRWHFWAGLLCAPVIVLLAITGALYLWKPQYEAWRYRELLTVPAPAAHTTALTPDALLAIAERAAPAGWRAQSYTPPASPTASAQVAFAASAPHGGHDRDTLSVFVEPATGRVLGLRDDGDTLMSVIKKIHGSLLLGTTGDFIVELSASWCFVLIVTGFYLWRPRPFTIRGFLLPRLGSGKRTLLRDLHAVPAVWCAAGTLFLLATGIPWASTGGKWFRTLAQTIGEWQPRETSASAHRSELLGGWSPYLDSKTKAHQAATVASSPPADEHAGHEGHATHSAPASTADSTASLVSTADSAAPAPSIPLTRVIAIAHERGVTDAYAIALPQGATGVYSILTDRNRAFTRAYIHLDRYTGRVLADIRFGDFGRVAKFFSFGIIAHEGQLFGLANQLLGLVVCLALIGTAITGVLLWWQRRPAGKLAAPQTHVRLPRPLLIGTFVLAAFLPLLAATLALLLILDRLLSRQLPWLRRQTT